MNVTQFLVTASFVVLAGVAALMWRRQRSAPTAWVLCMFSVLAAGRLIGDLLPAEPEALREALRRVVPVLILTFPYLLFRFSASLEPVGRRAEAVVGAVAGTAVLATAVLPHPQTGAPDPAWYSLYLVAAVSYWTAISAWVVWRLWRGGTRQPTVARRRMRTLAAGAACLNVALVVVGIDRAAEHTSAVETVAFASAVLFFLGFVPPRFVRAMWRRPDEQALWAVERDLVAATTRDEVVSYMLPRVSRLLGGRGAMFVDRSGGETVDGVPAARIDELRERLAGVDAAQPASVLRDGVVTLGLHQGCLGIVSNPYTPVFGRDELETMAQLGTLIDLALSRAELYERETRARSNAEALRGELEELVYGLSHDLRSPIVSVLGYVECLADDHGHLLDDEGRYFLSRLRTNTTYMDELISDLLELSRVGRVPSDPAPVDLTALCRQLAKELEHDNPRATFEIGRLPTVAINPARARQLLTNLLNNAVFHSGREDVTVRVVQREAQEPGRGCVAIVDDGKGIAPEYRERVFRLFEQLHRAPSSGAERPSSGVGLAISRKIVEQAEGRIWVADSTVGADIRIELPLASPATEREAVT